MENKYKMSETQKKIHSGILKVKDKLIEDKKKNNGSLVVIQDGEILIYKP